MNDYSNYIYNNYSIFSSLYDMLSFFIIHVFMYLSIYLPLHHCILYSY